MCCPPPPPTFWATRRYLDGIRELAHNYSFSCIVNCFTDVSFAPALHDEILQRFCTSVMLRVVGSLESTVKNPMLIGFP